MHSESKVIELWPKLGASSGLHLLGEWYGCSAPRPVLEDPSRLQRLCLFAAQRAEMEVAGHLFHLRAPLGVTGVILFAGAHLAIHTWPARRSATADVFVGGRTRKDRALARALYAFLRDGFLPSKENFVQLGGGVPAVALPPR